MCHCLSPAEPPTEEEEGERVSIGDTYQSTNQSTNQSIIKHQSTNNTLHTQHEETQKSLLWI